MSSFENAFEFAKVQLRNLVETYPDYFPMYTVDGKWKHTGELWTNWCEGFLPGMLWIVARRTEDAWFIAKAEHYSRLLEHRKNDRNVHDLGFLFWSSWRRWHQITEDSRIRDVIVEAGSTLSLRFQEKGGYLCSFIGKESLFIDIMMNVGIIFYAAQQSGDKKMWDLALQHCFTTRRFIVRGDGSTAHEGIFDTETGEFLRQDTHQGWRGDSCWARGLAWALYGFGTAYAFTGEARFLSTAHACADFFLANVDQDGIPANDFDDPDHPDLKDSSAAAIAASGLWQLSQLTYSETRAQHYRRRSVAIVETLCSPDYLGQSVEGWEGILRHGVYHLEKGLGVDESVMWGEYFFMEALLNVLNAQELE